MKKGNNNSKKRNKDNLKLPLSLFSISEYLEKVREMSSLSKPLFTMCIPKIEMQHATTPPLSFILAVGV